MTDLDVVCFNVIGHMVSEQLEPYQASRQPDEKSLSGKIILKTGQNFEQALQDLSGCTHVWVIYQFHLNSNWKPLVQTPRANRKIGVFATRSPYRPNQIGLSLVELKKVEGLILHLGPNDILNDSPILDIKPYHPEFDQVSEAEILWLKKDLVPKMKVTFSPVAENQIDFLESLDSSYQLLHLKSFIERQLEYDPLNSQKKRVEPNGALHTLSYRTWRIDFVTSEDTVAVISVRSGYTEEELFTDEDVYADKKAHKLYLVWLGS